MSSATMPARCDRPWLRFARRGAYTLGISAFIGAVALLASRGRLGPTIVYPVAISVGCWFFIDGGTHVLSRWLYRREPEHEQRERWPKLPWMVLVIVVGTALGVSIGTALGNWVTGLRVPGLLGGSASKTLGVLLVSMIPGAAATYFFYSRQRLAVSEATAQTAQRQAAENQLKLLESQLEPHMLFNTLANLRVLIGIDPPRAQAMLDRLIAFLRATLEASRAGSQTLADEFARIADYLELMKIRMGDRLQPRLELPAELASRPLPPLLLQPLVENAIKHGLEPHVGGGRLVVSAARDGDTLVLRVRDTGAGLGAAPAGGTRFGLAQVRERLATLHGDAATVELTAADDGGGGSVATVRLPMR